MVNSDSLFLLPLSFPLIAVVAGAMSRRPERPYGVPLIVGALPVYVFFWLGRALARHLVVLGLVCAASAVPVGFYFLIGWILTLGVTHCPPDAYECPV